MSRLVRFTFRNGDIRMGHLPNGRTLGELWSIFKRDGEIVGEHWCAQFDHVAMIEVVESGAPEETRPTNSQAQPSQFSPLDRLAIMAGSGAIKPGEA